MTILVKAAEVDLDLTNGHTLVIPNHYGMVHDESGRQLPKTSLFFGPIEMTGERIEKLPDDATGYFGIDYEGQKAWIDLPTGKWNPVGHVARIVYFRPGRYEGDWEHDFAEPQPLYRQRQWHLLQLPPDARVTWRGIERP